MKAVTWHGTGDVRVEKVNDPRIEQPDDVIVAVTSTAICGSDLHLYGGLIPSMKTGDILGHEFMGEVVEAGPEVRSVRKGDRVVVPFTIACGACDFCHGNQFSLCDRSNPNAAAAEAMWGHSPAGLFGYSHLLGGFAGGQAEYVRVPYANVGPYRVPPALTDEQVLFLSDILPTGYQAAFNCAIEKGHTVAVWGCGPVGQLAIQCARLLGAERVIAIDRFEDRLTMAEKVSGAEVLNYEREGPLEALREMTGGRGPHSCIDAVGMEAHGSGLAGLYDRTKASMKLETDRPTALRECLQACRKGGTVSLAGVYGGVADKIPLGAAFNKSLTLKMGQTHVQRWMPKLCNHIEQGEIDPGAIITHRLSLDEAPAAYEMFRNKADQCVKVVLRPH